MRRFLSGSTSSRIEVILKSGPGRISAPGRKTGIAILLGLVVTATAQAQPSAPSTADASSKTQGARPSYVAAEKLVLLVDNVGLKNVKESWEQTGLFKLLTGTPVGAMLETVATQLFDQTIASEANRKATGAEIVSLVKHVALNGYTLAINATDKGPRPYRITLVLKDAATKSLRPVSSRVLGMAMGDIRPRLIRNENRSIVAVDVPAAGKLPDASAPGSASKVAVVPWVWWAEKDDIVIGLFQGDDGLQIVNAIEKKIPVATLSPAKNASGTTLATRMLDLADYGGAGEKSGWLVKSVGKIREITGSKAVIQHLNFDKEAMVTTTRLVTAKPFTAAPSLFDAPMFKKTELIPFPEGVHTFATFSIKPERLLSLAEMIDPSGDLNTKVTEFSQSLKTSSRIDVEKDLLVRMGPKMTFYLSPVRSATAEEESFSLQSIFSEGVNVKSLMALTHPFTPEATFVAEIREPAAFGKALDGFIIALNKELKARATEFEEALEAEKPEPAGVGAGRRRGEDDERGSRGARGSGGTGDRGKARKPAEVLYPSFSRMPSPMNVRKFQLSTPSASKFRLGPPQFRPVIYTDLKYLVVASSADPAKFAIEALEKKGWKPSPEIETALSTVSENVSAVAVIDSSNGTASLLASLPGTLQSYINTGIALGKSKAGPISTAQPAATTPAQAQQIPARRHAKDADDELIAPGGGGGRFSNEGGFAASTSGQGGGRSFPNGPGSSGQSQAAVPQTVQFNISAEQLPKSDDIKAHLFPTSISITEDDGGLTITQRSAFPEHIGFESQSTLVGFLVPLIQAGRAQILNSPAPAQPAAAATNNQGNPNGPGFGGRRRRDD